MHIGLAHVSIPGRRQLQVTVLFVIGGITNHLKRRYLGFCCTCADGYFPCGVPPRTVYAFTAIKTALVAELQNLRRLLLHFALTCILQKF
jgi:hypothetical protein